MESKSEKPLFLVLNYKDPNDPEAGGAEKYCYEMSLNSVVDGFSVVWISRKHKRNRNVMDNPDIRYLNVGGKYTYYLVYLFKLLSFKPSAALISINSIPYIIIPKEIKNKVIHIHHFIPFSVIKQKVKLLSPIAYVFQRYLLPYKFRNSVVSTNGQEVKRELEKLGFKKVFQIRTVVDRSLKRKINLLDLILAPGALRPWKRPFDIITAYIESNIKGKLVIFGRPENEQILTDIQSLIKSKNLEKRVIVTPNITDDYKIELYSQAIFAVVAPLKEGVGLSALEPQAFGCPIIGYNVSGINECIVNGVNGILVKDGDIHSLGIAIKTLYEDFSLRNRMSAECIRFSSNYDSKTAYLELKELLF